MPYLYLCYDIVFGVDHAPISDTALFPRLTDRAGIDEAKALGASDHRIMRMPQKYIIRINARKIKRLPLSIGVKIAIGIPGRTMA